MRIFRNVLVLKAWTGHVEEPSDLGTAAPTFLDAR